MMHRKLPFCLAIGLALGWATLACNFPRASSTADIERTIEAISQTLVAAASMAPATAKPSPTPPAGLAGAGLPAQRPTPYPAHPGPAYAYDARAGDTLDGLAGRFGVAAGQITSDLPLPTQGHLPAGQRLWIPHVLGSTSAAEILLPDSELLYSPAASDFDVRDFVDRAGGHLSRYRETREDGAELDGATIVQRVSAELSVNPRLLLALLEVRSHWLYGGPPDAAQGENPFGFDIPERSGLYQETKIAATQLNLAFYGWRAGTFTEIRFSNGESLRLDPRLNAGSAALLHFFALFSEPDAWEESLYAPGGFPTRYEQMFGSPWARAAAVEPLLAPHLAQPVLELPFSPGERWSLTAGPHQAWNYGTPRGALDFSPITGGLPCDVSPAWAALEMAEAVIFDKRKILPVCVKLEGEYGVKGLFVGVPCILGKNGIEKVVELDLTDEEKAAFAKSAAGVAKTCEEAEGMLKTL